MILIGAGGHAKVIIDILKSINQIPEFIVDDNPELSSLLGIEVRRNCGPYNEAIIAIGKNEIRRKISEQISVDRYIKAIHSSAIISDYAKIDYGTVIMQGAIIQSSATIGKHCIVNTGATIDHDCKIHDFVHISPNATLCGNVTVGEGCWIGAGTVVVPGVKIGAWSIIGAGSVVTKDISNNVIAFGNKCRIIKPR